MGNQGVRSGSDGARSRTGVAQGDPFDPDKIHRDDFAGSLRASFRGPIVEADEWRPLADYVLNLMRLARAGATDAEAPR